VKAAVHTRYGPPDVVRIAEVGGPRAGDHEVLVGVHATTVNRTDCGFRAAHPWIVRFFSGLLRPKVSILGTEFAGVVDAVGSDVTSFQAGDRVFGFSEDRWGAHAEYLAIPGDGPLAHLPADVTFEEVAPSTEGSHYALSFIRKAKVRSGQHVLVNGATGAIGSAAVQLLKRLGAIVTAVCATEHVGLVQPGRRPGDRPHGRGLHEGRAEVRRGPRRRRKSSFRAVQAMHEASRIYLSSTSARCPRTRSWR
jgi:NADPH:quinone reductase-like Zn-dependent oxidoreductase